MYNSCPQNAIVLKATQGDMAYTCFFFFTLNLIASFITERTTSYPPNWVKIQSLLLLQPLSLARFRIQMTYFKVKYM